MSCTDFAHPDATTSRFGDGVVFAALELSRKSWLVATSAPGEERISKRKVSAGDGAGLLALLRRVREMAERRLGRPVRVMTIQEAGLDGFWVHRLLVANDVESHVVDAASIAVDRRKRRRKTDAIDVEGLLRTRMAWARGERRVCSMVRPPSPEGELGAEGPQARRRLGREREALMRERIRHTNRIKGLLAGQGVGDFDPLRPAHRQRLDELRTGDGRPLPARLVAEIRRQFGRLDAVVRDLEAVEAERDVLVGVRPADNPEAVPDAAPAAAPEPTAEPAATGPAALLTLLANSEAAIWTATLGGNPRSEPSGLTGFRASSGLIVAFANSVRCCSGSRASGRSSRPCSGSRRCSAASATGARLRPMPGLPRLPGRAATSTATRASPRRAMRGCARR